MCQRDVRYSIFNEAAEEVLQVLQEKCEMAFQASPAYEVLLRKAEKDEAEMQALDKVGLFNCSGKTKHPMLIIWLIVGRY